MSNFFDKYFNIKKMLEEKREYKQQMARIKALPEDYQYVYNKIQEHMWLFAAGSGYDMIEIQYGLIDLFEGGAAAGKSVLEITGDDVASFVDELLKSAKTYTENRRTKLNEDISKKLKG